MNTERHGAMPSLAVAAVAIFVWLSPVFAGEKTDERYQTLINQIRCLVCQNQTIADSQATLANDLKREIKQMIDAGKSDEQIVTFLVDRYGDFVLYKPPVQNNTLLLWAAPAVFVMIGAVVFLRILNQRRRLPAGELPEVREDLGST